VKQKRDPTNVHLNWYGVQTRRVHKGNHVFRKCENQVGKALPVKLPLKGSRVYLKCEQTVPDDLQTKQLPKRSPVYLSKGQFGHETLKMNQPQVPNRVLSARARVALS